MTRLTAVQSADCPGRDAPGDPTVLLLLHGFGADERDLASLSDWLPPGVPWVALRAPIALMQGGYAWFAIRTPGHPDPGPVAAATEAIWAWVENQLPAHARVLPIGFSQGGLMASQLLRTRPERVAGTVILGGFVQGAEQPADGTLAAERPPVFWGRGAEDPVIATAAIDRTTRWLPNHATLTARVYPGLGHGIDLAEITDVAAFVSARTSAPTR